MKIFAETERLLLRELLPSDDSGMFELDSDSEVQRYLGNNPIKQIEEARNTIEFIRQQYLENGIGRWAVIEKETKSFVGWAGLKYVRETTNCHTNYYDLGYRFIKRFWGYGYATEAAKASIDFGFEQLKIKDIYAMADVSNGASRRVLEKVGLTYVETFDLNGIPHNWFRITRA